MPILKVSGVSKVFRTYKSGFHRILSWFYFPSRVVDEVRVIKDISFVVMPGEAVGIVGRNGAGKSTLLKLIVGTLKPSEGVIGLKGRVAAILELGMGFNEDLTGRQNAYYAAGLMGYTQSQIDSVMGDIESFSEIGHYFDLPVRLYSSGMQMRVAFSVATAFRPDVLIVDEALSVGDAYFQHKSFDRIRDFRQSGTSLLIVSHDKSAIQTLCDRAIMIEEGRIVKDGRPEEVMDFYNACLGSDGDISEVELEGERKRISSGTGEASVERVALVNGQGDELECVSVGQSVSLVIEIAINSDLDRLVVGFGVRDRLGQVIYGINTFHQDKVVHNLRAGDRVTFRADLNMNLGPGSYAIQTALVSSDTHIENNYEWVDLAHVFNVVNRDKAHFDGLVYLDADVSVCSTTK